MRLIFATVPAFFFSMGFTSLASAQVTASNPAVLDVIGDVNSESARKTLFKSVKKKPNSSACKAGEWEKLGFRHAYKYEAGGKEYDDRWEMVQEKCAKAKVVPDKARYDAGYLEGRIMHCGYERGLLYGYYYEGKERSPICEGLQSQTYAKGLAHGKVINKINDDRHSLRSTYDKIQQQFTDFSLSVSGQPSTVEEQDLMDELVALRGEVEAELTLHESTHRELRVTYHLADIYHRRLPDAELNYDIPPAPRPLN